MEEPFFHRKVAMASLLYPVESKDILSRAGRAYGRTMDWLSAHPLLFVSVFFGIASLAFSITAVFVMSFAQ
jgi:hypothetical protein